MAIDRTIYWDRVEQVLIDSDGTRIADANRPKMTYQDYKTWKIFVVDDNGTTLDAADLSSITSFEINVADDFDHDTDPMVQVLNADINSGAGGDVLGGIEFTFDADTAEYLAAVLDEENTSAWLCVKGFNSSVEQKLYFRFQITADNILVPTGGGSPSGTTSNYWTKTQSALIFTSLNGGAQKTLTDDDTTNITLGGVDDYGSFNVLAAVDDGTYKATYLFTVDHIGGTARVLNLPPTMGYDFSGTMSWDADISGDNVRLNITMAGHGSNPSIVYNILNRLPVST